jgi:hypothetical protein
VTDVAAFRRQQDLNGRARALREDATLDDVRRMVAPPFTCRIEELDGEAQVFLESPDGVFWSTDGTAAQAANAAVDVLLALRCVLNYLWREGFPPEWGIPGRLLEWNAPRCS